MYYLVGINSKRNEVRVLATGDRMDSLVYKWISDITGKIVTSYVNLCNQGRDEYCNVDTIIKDTTNRILEQFEKQKGKSLLILDEKEYSKLISAINEAQQKGKDRKIKVEGVNVEKSIDKKKLVEVTKIYVAKVLHKIDPRAVKKHKVLSKYLKKSPEKVKVVKKFAKEKTTIVVNKYVQFNKEVLTEGMANALTELESEELDKGMGFGIKLVIILFIIMLLIYAYEKFVKQGVPLWNI